MRCRTSLEGGASGTNANANPPRTAMSAPNGVPLCVGAVLSTQHQTFAKVLARLPARKRVSATHWGSAQRCTSTCFGSWTPTASPTSPSHLSHTSKPKQACELYGLVHNKLRAHVASCTRFAHLMTKLIWRCHEQLQCASGPRIKLASQLCVPPLLTTDTAPHSSVPTCMRAPHSRSLGPGPPQSSTPAALIVNAPKYEPRDVGGPEAADRATEVHLQSNKLQAESAMRPRKAL